MARVIHLAVGGMKHWWGEGWHTACGKLYPKDEGHDGSNTTEDKDEVTCKSCRMSMHYECSVCHVSPRIGCVCEETHG